MGDAPHFDATQAKHKKEPKKVKLKSARATCEPRLRYHVGFAGKSGFGGLFEGGNSLEPGQDSPGDVKMTIDRETKTPRWANQEATRRNGGNERKWGKVRRAFGRQKDYNSDSGEFEYATFRPVGFCLGI